MRIVDETKQFTDGEYVTNEVGVEWIEEEAGVVVAVEIGVHAEAGCGDGEGGGGVEWVGEIKGEWVGIDESQTLTQPG